MRWAPNWKSVQWDDPSFRDTEGPPVLLNPFPLLQAPAAENEGSTESSPG